MTIPSNDMMVGNTGDEYHATSEVGDMNNHDRSGTPLREFRAMPSPAATQCVDILKTNTRAIHQL